MLQTNYINKLWSVLIIWDVFFIIFHSMFRIWTANLYSRIAVSGLKLYEAACMYILLYANAEQVPHFIYYEENCILLTAASFYLASDTTD